jgi:tetratricopeptide (TPR) repeat protein
VGLAAQDARALDDAEFHYVRALELSPKMESARLNLGITLGQKGDLPGARSQFQILLQSPHAQYQSLAQYHLGLDAYYFKKYKEAVDWFEKSLKSDPTSADGYKGKAILYASVNKRDLALTNWKAYLAKTPEPNKKVPKELVPLVGGSNVR